MTGSGCAWCGARVVEHHHPSGRVEPNGPYLDGELVIALCKAHHALAHVMLRRLGLDWLPVATPPLPYRVRRLAVHVGHAASLGRPVVFEPAVAWGLHALLLDAADLLAVAP